MGQLSDQPVPSASEMKFSAGSPEVGVLPARQDLKTGQAAGAQFDDLAESKEQELHFQAWRTFEEVNEHDRRPNSLRL